jgi:hypothetical protein
MLERNRMTIDYQPTEETKQIIEELQKEYNTKSAEIIIDALKYYHSDFTEWKSADRR